MTEKYTILLLGEKKTGKSTFFKKYFKKPFQEEYKATIDSKIHWFWRNHHEFTVREIAGGESYDYNYIKFRSINFYNASAAIIFYDVNDEYSFKKIKYYEDQLKYEKLDIPIIYCGNKNDLPVVNAYPDSDTTCTISCKNNVNIDKPFRLVYNLLGVE